MWDPNGREWDEAVQKLSRIYVESITQKWNNGKEHTWRSFRYFRVANTPTELTIVLNDAAAILARITSGSSRQRSSCSFWRCCPSWSCTVLEEKFNLVCFETYREPTYEVAKKPAMRWAAESGNGGVENVKTIAMLCYRKNHSWVSTKERDYKNLVVQWNSCALVSETALWLTWACSESDGLRNCWKQYLRNASFTRKSRSRALTHFRIATNGKGFWTFPRPSQSPQVVLTSQITHSSWRRRNRDQQHQKLL